MAPGTITAIAYLLIEALSAGISLSNIIAEAKARDDGKIPPERWAAIQVKIADAEAAWEAAGRPPT